MGVSDFFFGVFFLTRNLDGGQIYSSGDDVEGSLGHDPNTYNFKGKRDLPELVHAIRNENIIDAAVTATAAFAITGNDSFIWKL